MGITAFLPIIGPAIQKLLELIPDPNARAEAEAEYQRAILDAAIKSEAEQREINRTEAQHNSIFVAGWRPAIGWVCASALAFQYLVRPFWLWVLAVWWPQAPVPPGLDGMLWELMFGMLGMGGLRSWDKTKGGK